MPQTPDWQPLNPIQAIMFDCDGTLSTIEGIDELAEQNNVGDIVQALTAKAMAVTGINPELYRERLNFVKPTLDQAENLARQYFAARTQDSFEVIQLLQRLNKDVYIASAGINPSVRLFAGELGVNAANVFAVDITFNDQGQYEDFDASSLLTCRDGKRDIASMLKQKHGSVALIGDGMNDVVAIDTVTRFIGYGGSVYREKIARMCQYYCREATMSAILPLLLTQEEYGQLLPDEATLYQRGVTAFLNKNHESGSK